MPPPKAPSLPAHLSYKSCLILIPPLSIQTPMEALRKAHDRNYKRWMPHINLIYPFLAKPSDSVAPVLKRVQRAVKLASIDGPIDIRIRTTDRFDHGKTSSTVWLAPSTETPMSVMEAAAAAAAEVNDKVTVDDYKDAESRSADALLRLQLHLQEEFSECDADTRPYIPHMSIGQAKGTHNARKLEAEAEAVMRDFCETATRADIAELMPKRTGADGIDDDSDGTSKGCGWELKWLVDKIFIAERYGFKDRFKVVGEFKFGQ